MSDRKKDIEFYAYELAQAVRGATVETSEDRMLLFRSICGVLGLTEELLAEFHWNGEDVQFRGTSTLAVLEILTVLLAASSPLNAPVYPKEWPKEA